MAYISLKKEKYYPSKIINYYEEGTKIIVKYSSKQLHI